MELQKTDEILQRARASSLFSCIRGHGVYKDVQPIQLKRTGLGNLLHVCFDPRVWGGRVLTGYCLDLGAGGGGAA